MKSVLLIAATTGYQTRAFAESARQLGFRVTLATDRCHVLENPWGDNAIPLRLEDPRGAASSIHGAFDGVIGVGDRCALVAALCAERLNLPFHSPAAVSACGNKFLAREHFKAAGLLVPDYVQLRAGDDPQQIAPRVAYPCVLKPLGLSASRGVIRADNPVEFIAAFSRIRRLLHTPEIAHLRDKASEHILVESYIPGREFALEGFMSDGELTTLALFDKPDPLEGPYFEETIYVTPCREANTIQQDLLETTTRAVRALGLTHGPIHAEMRHNEAGTWMLEVAARPIGGLCARTLRFTGQPLESVLLRNAVQEDPAPLVPDGPASGVMMIPIPVAGLFEGTHGVEQARGVPDIEGVEITAIRGQRLVPLPEGSSYLGFIFARGASPERVEAALRLAHQQLSFTITPVLTTLAPAR